MPVTAMKDLPVKKWYDRQIWRYRRAAQLRAHPVCERCQGRGVITLATVVHHAIPHKGDLNLFLTAPLVSLCADCHDVDEQRIERGSKPRAGVDAWGWPLDKK